MKVNKILISQVAPCRDSSPYFNLLNCPEIQLDFYPFIEVKELSASEVRRQKIDFSAFSAIIFTSKNAIDYFFKMAEEIRFKVPDSMKYFCQVEAIANYLQKYIIYRKRKIYVGQKKFDSLFSHFSKHQDEKYLLPSSDILKEDMDNALTGLNLDWKRVILFNTIARDLSHLDIASYDFLVFFTPLEITSFNKNFPDFKQKNIKIAAFGESTQKEARKVGWKLDIEAPTAYAPSMAMALEKYLEENHVLKKIKINM